MSSKRSENVKHEEPENHEMFQEGDVVALTQSALRTGRLLRIRNGKIESSEDRISNGRIEGFMPRVLYALGHPNKFLVLATFEHEEHGQCLTLYPCCTIKPHEGFVDRADNNKPRCQGHPAMYFEKADHTRIPRKGDKASSVHLPFLPFEVAGIHYEEDEHDPRLTLNLVGQKFQTTGPLANFFKKIAEDSKIL